MAARPVSPHTFADSPKRSWPAAEEGPRRRPREFNEPWVEIDGVRVVVRGSPRARTRTRLKPSPSRTAAPTAGTGGTVVTLQPGPGERATPPGPDLRSSRQHRTFQGAVDAWIADGVDYWWRVEVEDYPPTDAPAARRRAYNRLHNGWAREIERRVKYDGLTGDYTARVVVERGATFFTWGPARDVPAAGADHAADADAGDADAGDAGGPAAPPA